MGNTPFRFGCGKCRLKWGSQARWGTRQTGTANRVELTGKTRANRRVGRREAQRSVRTLYQYTCKDCGHTGWSGHPDVAHLADRTGVAPHETDAWGHRRFADAQDEEK